MLNHPNFKGPLPYQGSMQAFEWSVYCARWLFSFFVGTRVVPCGPWENCEPRICSWTDILEIRNPSLLIGPSYTGIQKDCRQSVGNATLCDPIWSHDESRNWTIVSFKWRSFETLCTASSAVFDCSPLYKCSFNIAGPSYNMSQPESCILSSMQHRASQISQHGWIRDLATISPATFNKDTLWGYRVLHWHPSTCRQVWWTCDI